MKLLDLYCRAGAAADGYYAAGFTEIIGVDIEPQPEYPYEFIQGDAIEVLNDLAGEVDAAHASPPCQRWSSLAHKNGNHHEHPDLIGPTREALESWLIPYVIENVPGAPLINPTMLCGTMFMELRVIRHRLFETNWPLTAPPHDRRHPLTYTTGTRRKHYGKLDQNEAYIQVTGGGNSTNANKNDAMGMKRRLKNKYINEAIPPAYTEWIGRQLIDVCKEWER